MQGTCMYHSEMKTTSKMKRTSKTDWNAKMKTTPTPVLQLTAFVLAPSQHPLGSDDDAALTKLVTSKTGDHVKWRVVKLSEKRGIFPDLCPDFCPSILLTILKVLPILLSCLRNGKIYGLSKK